MSLLSTKERTRKEYVNRINRVIDYIGAHLDQRLPLEELAAVAAFSPFHFHRLFKAMVGESLTEFINRLRLERAAGRLKNDPDASITAIAFEYGFSSSSHFARAFKRHFGQSATRYRETVDRRNPAETTHDDPLRKIGQTMRKNGIPNRNPGQAFAPPTGYNPRIPLINPNYRRSEEMNVDVKTLPGYRVAYVRVMDGYTSNKIQPAFQKVLAWAGARDLMGPDTLVIGVSLDNPDVTPADKCRYDACVTVPPGTRGEGEIGVYDIPAGKYAIYRVEGHYATINPELGQAWNELMGGWFPDSGYQPDDRPCFEIYRETEAQMKAGQYVVDICEPVKPL